MEAIAISRFVPTSQRKIQRVLNLIKNKDVEEAMNILYFTNKRAAYFILKTLKAAFANAKQKKFNLAPKDVYVKAAYATSGGMIKHFRIRARGRVDLRRRRRAHIYIIVGD